MKDDIFHAVADRQRRFILALLRGQPMYVSDIRSHLSVTAATLSHHLDILKRADLVTAERHGRRIQYALNEPVFRQVLATIADMFTLPSR